MPPIELEGRLQTAVLWESAGVDEYGAPVVYAPVEIEVRWEASTKRALDSKSNVVKTDGVLIVDRDIPLDSIMWLGRLLDLDDPPRNLKQVISSDSTPDIRSRQDFKEATTMRYSGALPHVVGTGS